jgi:hypothetical protein
MTIELRLATDPDHVMIRLREDWHMVGEDSCDCAARAFGQMCSHLKLVKGLGGVEKVRAALEKDERRMVRTERRTNGERAAAHNRESDITDFNELKDETMKALTPTMGIFGPCRLSYMHVFKPRMNEMKGEEEYGVVLLIPKQPNDFNTEPAPSIKLVADMIKAAAAEKFGASVAQYDRPLKDGDKELNNEGEPRYPGYWYIRVTAKVDYPPVLIDGNRKAVTNGFESGDWGIVKASFYGYDFKGRKGVSAGLRAIQFVAKDEPFGTATDPTAVANEFDVVAGAATASPSNDEEDDPFAD